MDFSSFLTVGGVIPKKAVRDRRYITGGFWASLIMLMDDVGFDLPRNIDFMKFNLDKIAISSINRWIKDQCQGVKHLSATIAIRGFEPTGSYSDIESLSKLRNLPLNTPKAIFCLDSGPVKELQIGRKLQKVDAVIPDLSQTILFELMRCSRKTLPLYLPESVLETVSFLYWHGEEDEKVALEELGLEGMDENSIADYCPWTLAELTQRFPMHVLNPVSKHSSRELISLMGEHSDEIGQLIGALLDVRQKIDVEFTFFPFDGLEQEICGFSTFLRWDGTDPTMQVMDDLWQRFAQSGEGEFELIGIDLMEMTSSSFQSLLAEWSKGFAAIKAADHLIDLISEPLVRKKGYR